MRVTARGIRMRRQVLALSMFTIFVAVVGFATDVLGETVRWDLALVVQGTAIAGGTNVATDLNVLDTITMTGSGQAPISLVGRRPEVHARLLTELAMPTRQAPAN